MTREQVEAEYATIKPQIDALAEQIAAAIPANSDERIIVIALGRILAAITADNAGFDKEEAFRRLASFNRMLEGRVVSLCNREMEDD